jgi:hypothetical protein
MKLKRFFTIAVAIVSMIFVQSCNNDEESKTASVQIKLVDFPGDYLGVNVNIVDVQYNSSEDEGGWKSFESFEGAVEVDLTKLVGGNNLLLTDQIMPSGMMKQIRLVLGDGNNVVVEGSDELTESTFALDTPSAQQSGLKLNLDTVLEPGFSYTFILDWDVQKSIVKTGSGKYILKPVIRVGAEARTGKVEGIVTEEKTVDTAVTPVALEGVIVNLYKSDANAGDAPFATTLTDADGYFIFEGLPTIDYKIVIEQVGYDAYTSEDFTVKVDVTPYIEILVVPTV